ncbi:hypothetical protein BVIET440_250056 [Burkholderia vietnamiensis]
MLEVRFDELYCIIRDLGQSTCILLTASDPSWTKTRLGRGRGAMLNFLARLPGGAPA